MTEPHHPTPSGIVKPASYRPTTNYWESKSTTVQQTQSRPSSIKPIEFPASGAGGGNRNIKPSRPVANKIANAVAPIFRTTPASRISALTEIAKLSGERPEHWAKPKFGEFEYWLAHNCGWITVSELQADTDAYQAKRQLAIETSHRFKTQRFTWEEGARYEEPADTCEYCPQINMKLVKDRNLTDSARRIAMFVMQKAYQDNRAGRYIGMTVSYIMKGLSISRRTVQRSLTLLETRGYFRCEVAKGDQSRMCIGLIVHLLTPLFAKHHKEKWPKRRRNPDASSMPYKQIHFYKRIYGTKQRTSRSQWTMKCYVGLERVLAWRQGDRKNNAGKLSLNRTENG